MTSSIYVASTGSGSGKSTVALGLVNLLERAVGRVAYFKPIGDAHGAGHGDAQLVKKALGLDFTVEEMEPVSKQEVASALANGTFDELLDRIIESYESVSARADFVVIEGTDYEGAIATFEFDINAELSKNLNAPMLLVADALNCFETTRSGKIRDPQVVQTMIKNVRMVVESLQEKNAEFFGLVINRADPAAAADIQATALRPLADLGIRILGTIPRTDLLSRPTIREIVQGVGGVLIAGEERSDVVAQDFLIAAMSLENVLARLTRGALVILPGDRDDLLLGLAAAYQSPVVPSPSGIVLTGGFQLHPSVKKLFLDITRGRMPVLTVATDTYATAVKVSGLKARLTGDQRTRIEVVKELVERHVDVEPIVAQAAVAAPSGRVTPKQFLHRIVDLARKSGQHVVLPEGGEERILRAAEAVVARRVARLTLLGDEADIRRKAGNLGIDLAEIQVIDPATSEWRERFAQEYMKLRAHKNPTWDQAYDLMADPAYFGTMMVQLGKAGGMVSGSVTTTAATLRPALEFVKTKEGYRIASSVFLMCLPDQVLVYGDCAVVPKPDAAQLADIALASAATAQAFEIEPRVAMLSYSTGASGTGDDVDKVRTATELVRERAPELQVEGPIQYDAAIDPAVAQTKLPGSQVAGRATVFIFPDLDAGNNTYKAVQRAARAIAIGPVMQGLRKPVNDLSRGCTVGDIFNTIAITAVQAGQQ